MAAIKTILVPTDFSETSMHAFDYACGFAKESRAKVVALHVVEPVIPIVADGIVMPFDVALARSAAEEELARLNPDERSVNFERMLRDGPAAMTIVDIADEIGADLIVMGTHGRRGLGRLLLGSVAEQVLRHSRRPVLFVKLPIAREHPAETEPEMAAGTR